MSRGLREIAFASCLIVAAACGSDDGSKAASLTVDSGTDADTPTERPDAASPRARDASVPRTEAADGCDTLKCKAPATCVMRDGSSSARCACPDGYDDTHGDGSQCDDKDECADSSQNDCGKNARCENRPGSYECTCKGPAYQGDGKQCTCADGFKEQDGACLAPDGKACEDNLDCLNAHCVSGLCCAVSCDMADAECRTTKGATCEDGHSCKYPTADDGSDCDDGDACTLGSTCRGGKCMTGTQAKSCDDDNPCTDDSCDHSLGCKNQNNTLACDDKNACTSDDRCNAGSCSGGSNVDCSAQNDACNMGTCDKANGSCTKQPVADGQPCDDALVCTKTDRCQAGACLGDGNACGPNATACAESKPATCTCAPTFHSANGVCVPDNDECAATTSPCGANATCFDPSNAANDVTCTCNPGYRGDGKTGCTAIDACAGNPCGDGRGTCAAADGGKYTCTCSAGYMPVDGQCVCDLNGTFALRTRIDQSWPTTSTIEGGSDFAYEWSIERHLYDDQGNLTTELINCGTTNFDLCGVGVAGLIPAEAYSQYVPGALVPHAHNSRPAMSTFSVPAPLPMSKFTAPIEASLIGISLTDPLGEWPADRSNIQGSDNFSGSAVNGARWIDSDEDALLAETTYTVGPNGAPADGSASAPLVAYGTSSQVCPRSNPNAARLPYNYPPANEGLNIRRIKRIFVAKRIVSGLDGSLESCDRISGVINGPDNGAPHFDTRVGGCLRAEGTDETACSSTLIDAVDAAAKLQNTVGTTNFVIQRVPDATTCEQVVQLTF